MGTFLQSRDLVDREVYEVDAEHPFPVVLSSTTPSSIRQSTIYTTSIVSMSVPGAYVTGDYVGPSLVPLSFPNAVSVSGGRGIIKSIAMTDKTTTAAIALELWLYSANFTAPVDSAAWDISDADNLKCLGVIPMVTSKWYASSKKRR